MVSNNTYEVGTKFNDVIDENIINSWNNNVIIFNGATGSGKTYFVQNNLHEYCKAREKTILFLCNRAALKKQVINEVEKLANIIVKSYQEIEEELKEDNEKIIGTYDFIVCDECHYFMSDALFNIYTDISFDWILKQAKGTSKIIFMSGTIDKICRILKYKEMLDNSYIYNIPYSYNYVEELQFYSGKGTAKEIIRRILEETEDKIVFFANSIDYAIEIYQEFKNDAVFRCSESTKNSIARKYNNLNCIKENDDGTVTFQERILVTTKVLDNGVNLVDRKIKHIISEIIDLESMKQSLGRKRCIDEKDICNFYIRNYSKNELNFKVREIKNQLDPIIAFKKDREQYYRDYKSDRRFHSNFIFYDYETKQETYNWVAYYQLLIDNMIMQAMLNNGYKEQVLDTLKEESFSKIVDLVKTEEATRINKLNEYLESIIDKRLDEEDKEKLIKMVNLKDNRGRLKKSISSISKYIRENYGLNLQSKQFKFNRKIKTMWILSREI